MLKQTNKKVLLDLESYVNGEQTIWKLAHLMFGDTLQMANKSLEERLKHEPCLKFRQYHAEGEKPSYVFHGISKTYVDGMEFQFSVGTRFVKKTGKYKLVSLH